MQLDCNSIELAGLWMTSSSEWKRQIEGWQEDAKKALLSAQQKCLQATNAIAHLRRDSMLSQALEAKIHFCSTELNYQARLADKIWLVMSEDCDSAMSEFKSSTEELFGLGEELGLCLDILGGISVDKAFGGDDRSLRDFVDETAVGELKAQIQAQSESTALALDTFSEQLKEFKRQSQELSALVFRETSAVKPVPLVVPLSQIVDEGDEPRPISIDRHAEQMTDLIESLTDNYDQCSRAASDKELSDEAELAEVCRILESDHEQALRSLDILPVRTQEIATVQALITDRLAILESSIAKLRDVVRHLAEYGVDSLQSYAEAHEEFAAQFRSHAKQLSLFRNEEAGLLDYYRHFIDSYYAMVLELGRRRGTLTAIERTFDEAAGKVEKVLAEESRLRSQFFRKHGQYLPSDLFPGLVDPLPSYRVESENTELPLLSTELLEKAMKHFDDLGTSDEVT